VLLTGVVLAPAAAVAAASLDRSLPFQALVWFSLLAIGLGLLFAYSGLPGAALHPLAAVIGGAAVLYFVANVLPNVPPDTSLTDRLGVLGDDAGTWYQQITTGGQSTDNLLFLLALGLLAWLIGYLGAWCVFRERSAWWPITTSTTAMAFVLSTFPKDDVYLLLEVVAGLLLAGRVNLLARQAAWETNGVRPASGVAGRATRAGLALPLALVALAWLLPAAVSEPPWSQQLAPYRRPWQQAQEEFHRMFGGLQATGDAPAAGFGPAMTLKGSYRFSDTPDLLVAAARPDYWRVIAFDQYTGQGWTSSDPIEQHVQPAGDVIGPFNAQQRSDVTQQVTVLAPRGNFLVGAAQPTTFDLDATTQAFPVGAGEDTDLVAVLAATPLEPNSQYTVVSSVSTAGASDLRSDGADYPAEVRQRYLALPSIPDRVRQLASQLTASAANPYDKAVAVQSYLRAMPYSVDLPPPPPDRDAVDYFLFDVRTGYCDYFASSMAVLLRSVGVPARVVAGFATGTPQDDGRYLVKDTDSHSWVEVYFPSYGWVPFEPSGALSTIPRGDGTDEATTPTPAAPTPAAGATEPADKSASQASSSGEATPTPTPTPTPAPGTQTTESRSQNGGGTIDPRSLLPLLYLIGGAILLAALLWWLWEKDLRGLPPCVVAYAKMTRLASLLGFRHRAHDTPREYARTLAAVVPEAGPGANQIAADYARYRFGRHAVDDDQETGQRWRVVRNALLRHARHLRWSRE
jgi:transglutaminase-like putative cysteine protease